MDKNSPPHTPRWGMVVDLNRCVGCQTCTVACKHANDTTPGVQWRQVLDVETGIFPDVERIFMVVGCQHCGEPPCVPVCPSGATKQRSDGLVTMDYNMCIGCGSCAVACPYQARTIVHEDTGYFKNKTEQEKVVAHSERVGVAQKCTFCIDRVDEGVNSGYTPGIDLNATPACSASCIASAIKFGDFNDPKSEVSLLTEQNNFFQMHKELGTDPQIKYLYETPSVPGRAKDEKISQQGQNPYETSLSGRPQPFWDMRAAMNFILGGFGAGLIAISYLTYISSGLEENILPTLYIIGAVIIVIGLFFVWLKIGRKFRALYVLLRPQTSWMSREVYAVGFLFAFCALDYFYLSTIAHLLVALAALVFLFCQAKILSSSMGIPAWRSPLIPWMLLFSGLYEGIGLLNLCLAIIFIDIDAINILVAYSLVLNAVNLYLWIRYIIDSDKAGISPLAQTILSKASVWVHLFAHFIPATFSIVLLIYPVFKTELLIGTGLAILVGSVIWKSVIIIRASHHQDFALEKYPKRGSGTYAAPLLSGFPLPKDL
ncbi:MAG: 4Fe-4S dicluster domain-containing protein [Pseudomonadota bacterium]|nr:4Fe-4S dicluster domain-containing protein [Pseudomonadota bacterium]